MPLKYTAEVANLCVLPRGRIGVDPQFLVKLGGPQQYVLESFAHPLQSILVWVVVAQDVEPAIPCPHFFSQIRRGKSVRVDRIPFCAMVTLVEGPDAGGGPIQSGCHHHLQLNDCEVHQRTGTEVNSGSTSPP